MSSLQPDDLRDVATPGHPYLARHGRVLVVDDDAVIRYLLTEMLDTEYEIEVAANGHEALRAAHDFQPEVVLTDLVMPDGDGWDLISELRKDPSFETTKIIAISGADRPPAHILDFGADDFVAKPFEPDELLARVAVAIRAGHRLGRLHGLLDALPIGVFLTEPSGHLLVVNAPLVLVLGYPSRSALCTQRIVDIVHDPVDRAELSRAIRTPAPAQVSCSMLTYLDDTFPAQLTVGPVTDDKGAVTGFAGTVTPIL